MKALLPVYCRILGYVVLLLSIATPFILMIYGIVDESNLQLWKEILKLFMMIGLVMILLAFTKNETDRTEKIRIRAMRNAFFLTILFLFGDMLVRLYNGDTTTVMTSSFIIYMVMNVLCLEFGLKKETVDKIFKR